MNYPLDKPRLDAAIKDIVETDLANRRLISQLHYFLELAIEFGAGELADWYPDAKKVMNEAISHNTEGAKPSESIEDYGTEELSEEELAKHFGEPPPAKIEELDISSMTIDDIKQWESDQDNSLDIYKVVARVKNLAREGGASLTPTGEMLINTYTHVLMALYGFATQIEDKNLRNKLIELVRANESMPANFINAVHASDREQIS